MTDLTYRLSPIAFPVKARTRVKWPSQGLGDMRSRGLHVIIPPHRTLLQPPHWSALTTPDSAPWTPSCCIEFPCEIPSQNMPQWPWVTLPPPKITWSSHDDCIIMRHLVGKPLSWQTWDLRVPTLFSCKYISIL